MISALVCNVLLLCEMLSLDINVIKAKFSTISWTRYDRMRKSKDQQKKEKLLNFICGEEKLVEMKNIDIKSRQIKYRF